MYHTALDAMPDAPRRGLFSHGDSLAFVHDVRDPLPAAFASCDVFYGEPPWPKGLRVFDERAGATRPSSYAAFARRLDELARGLSAPVYYVTGRGTVRHFRPDASFPLKLHRNRTPAVCLVYRGDRPRRAVACAEDLLLDLADRHARVGDFLAGCGRAGRVFASRGKSFVLSDYNPSCVGHVAAHAAEWTTP